MGTYYEFKGTLTFPSAAIAKAAFTELTTTDKESVFYLWPGMKRDKALAQKGTTIVFNDCNFAGAEPFYSARAALGRVVDKAVSGRVRVQEGDEPGADVSFYGFKPRRPVKPTAKKAAKKARKKAPKKVPSKKTAKKRP